MFFMREVKRNSPITHDTLIKPQGLSINEKNQSSKSHATVPLTIQTHLIYVWKFSKPKIFWPTPRFPKHRGVVFKIQ